MTGGDLPDSDDVVHYVRPSDIRPDGSLKSGAFSLRKNETELSVNWIEYWHNAGYKNPMREIRAHFGLTTRPNGSFAQFNVGRSKESIVQEWQPVRFVHAQTAGDPSHSEIKPYPVHRSPAESLVSSLIAGCVTELHSAVDN